MCVYIYIYIYTHTHTHIHIYVHMHTHTNIYIYILETVINSYGTIRKIYPKYKRVIFFRERKRLLFFCKYSKIKNNNNSYKC